ncbi:hypothetical protein AS026_37710 [Rhizobium altiplani]|uniref:Uncharacterized protein n=1 Tax=Rhizobium altiplani TaxID=1864509 RepID=A0A109JUE2_9HYPH|nr:hypothetical protein AS026_37710 [Rhizobium altiplani]
MGERRTITVAGGGDGCGVSASLRPILHLQHRSYSSSHADEQIERHQPNIMPKPGDFASPVMSARSRFKPDKTRWKLAQATPGSRL